MLFDANGNITKMVNRRRLGDVGGILFKWAFYGGLENSSKKQCEDRIKKWFEK